MEGLAQQLLEQPVALEDIDTESSNQNLYDLLKQIRFNNLDPISANMAPISANMAPKNYRVSPNTAYRIRYSTHGGR